MTSPRIGVIPRVDRHEDRDEERDALDRKLSELLIDAGLLPFILPTRGAAEEYVDHLDGVVLSGGNDLASIPAPPGVEVDVVPERDALERRMLELSVARSLPVFGICRGMQLMADAYGCALVPVEGHVARRHGLDLVGRDELGIGGRDEVNSFHRFAVSPDGVADELVPLALADDGTIEAFRHREHHHAAVMWHPERAPAHAGDAKMLHHFFVERPHR